MCTASAARRAGCHRAAGRRVRGAGLRRPAGCAGDAHTGIHKIKHVVVIMQENRSFDSYFGTYPGANGIPTADGKFTVCNPDPKNGAATRRTTTRTTSTAVPATAPARRVTDDRRREDGPVRRRRPRTARAAAASS